MRQSRSFAQKMYRWLTRLDTQDARKVLSEDARKSSNFLLGLAIIMLPGLPSIAVKVLGKAFELDLGSYTSSTNPWIFVLMLFFAIFLRVFSFIFGSKWPGDKPTAKKIEDDKKSP